MNIRSRLSVILSAVAGQPQLQIVFHFGFAPCSKIEIIPSRPLLLEIEI
jgi:hypothetical protein